MNRVHDAASAPEELSGVDLNLMVAFAALAREKSVTRAAQRVGITQSAMSHALGRLRQLLGDALLVRGQSGMVLTPRAEGLTVPVQSALVTLGRALSGPGAFVPGEAQRAFRLCAPDLFDVVVMPALLARLQREAPGVDLSLLPPSQPRLTEKLETGELDLAVMVRADDTESEHAAMPGLVRKKLFQDHWLCFVRSGHPALAGKRKARAGDRELSLERFTELAHVLVSPGGEGRGLVDAVLARRKLARRVALTVPSFYSALEIAAQSDLVLTAPSALARLAERDGRLLVLRPPVPLPSHGVYLAWHERYATDPGHAWLRGVLSEVAVATQHGPKRGRARRD